MSKFSENSFAYNNDVTQIPSGLRHIDDRALPDVLALRDFAHHEFCKMQNTSQSSIVVVHNAEKTQPTN